MLESKCDSKFVGFEVVERNDEDGIVKARDIVNHKIFYILDSNLGQVKGKLMYFCHMQTYDDITFCTGLNFVFEKNSRLRKWMKSHQRLLQKHDRGQLIIIRGE